MAELGAAACIGGGCVHQELLTRPMVASLSKTTFGILLPMFLGTSIMKTVAKYGLNKSSLAGPLLGMLQPFLLYQITTLMLLPLFGIDCDSDEGRSTAVCSAWGNSSVVPLIFVESLFRHNPEYLARSYATISLFLVGWSPFFWSYGRSALLGSSSSLDEENVSILSKVRKLFSPPVTGVSIGLILAMFTPIRSLFMGPKAPLQTIFSSFETFGRAASPLSLLVLTSSLALNVGVSGKQEDKLEASTKRTADPDQKSHSLKMWGCVSVARFLVSPLLVVGLLRTFCRLGLIQDPTKDPIVWFISILQGCMPSAQNLVLMLQVANKPEQSGTIARFLFFVYATSMVPVVFIVSMALQHLGLA
eukprot:scaffold12324_cov144-Cylindrotheca_fusiformis.AAC.6